MLGKATRSLGPVLAMVAGLLAGASCGGDDTPSEEEAKELCEAACNNLNDCDQGCKPGEYVDACARAIAGGDEARKKEVECVKDAACSAIPACLGSTDRCAGVTCDSPLLCDPDSGTCATSECTFRDMNQPCVGDEFCFRSFCVNAYPRTYRFTYGVVVTPALDSNNNAWDPDGPPDLQAQIRVNGVVAGISPVLKDRRDSADLNGDLNGTAAFDIPLEKGDEVLVGVFDDDGGNAQQILQCTLNDLPNTLRFFTGMNCSQNPDDPAAPHVVVAIEAI